MNPRETGTRGRWSPPGVRRHENGEPKTPGRRKKKNRGVRARRRVPRRSRGRASPRPRLKESNGDFGSENRNYLKHQGGMQKMDANWRPPEPLEWYRLIHVAETVRAWWPLGLASVWAHINGGDYEAAKREIHRVLVDVERGVHGPPHSTPKVEGLAVTPQHWREVIAYAPEVKRNNTFVCIKQDCGNTLTVGRSNGDGRCVARECGWSVGSEDIGDESVCPMHRAEWGR